jgi:glucuronate isomerase
MSLDLRRRLFAELDKLVLVDPHTHINPLDPGSHTLADILGYHYYTELAHSAGMPKAQIEEPGLAPKEKVRRLIENLGPVQNTIQYSWLVEMCQTFFGLTEPDITPRNWERVYDSAEMLMCHADWPQQVLRQSKIEAVFLTNDFDDPLEDFDTSVYIPCLRTDDLVFHLARPDVQDRLERSTGIAPSDARSLRRAIAALFLHFKSRGARACAISLPPDFTPTRVSPARANTALAAIHEDGNAAGESHRKAIGNYVFWTLAEMCDAFRLPFDLMIGVNRGVYAAGVHQGRDLYDSRVSLIQYKELFNSFPGVTFPISVLASVTNQELTSYAWIFPNVTTNGHWWYSNTPAFIEHDLAARLEAVPRTKQIGYYSDMYKLEFALPKFAMFKRILAKVLAERFVIDRGWTESQAIALGEQVLRGNVETMFRWGQDLREELPDESLLERMPGAAAAGGVSVLGAITGPSESSDSGPEELGIYSEPKPEPEVEVPLRSKDDEVVIPVPPADEEGQEYDFELEVTTNEAAAEEPPALEVVSDSDELDLDQSPVESTESGGIFETSSRALPSAEEAMEEIELDVAEVENVAEEIDESVRQTEPFPFRPAPSNKPGGDWDFLQGKTNKK